MPAKRHVNKKTTRMPKKTDTTCPPSPSASIAARTNYSRTNYSFQARWQWCIIDAMNEYGFTAYFENEVLRKRPYLRKEWCIRVVEKPLRMEPQEHDRFRFWGAIEELEGRVLRVITLADRRTIHNAFPDRSFKP
jgi:hypothetical protein